MCKLVVLVVLDFTKAFDTIPHRRLFGHYGTNGHILRRREVFLGDRENGRRHPVSIGEILFEVLQGTLLGLFLIHTNDLPPAAHPQVYLFADVSAHLLQRRPVNNHRN